MTTTLLKYRKIWLIAISLINALILIASIYLNSFSLSLFAISISLEILIVLLYVLVVVNHWNNLKQNALLTSFETTFHEYSKNHRSELKEAENLLVKLIEEKSDLISQETQSSRVLLEKQIEEKSDLVSKEVQNTRVSLEKRIEGNSELISKESQKLHDSILKNNQNLQDQVLNELKAEITSLASSFTNQLDNQAELVTNEFLTIKNDSLESENRTSESINTLKENTENKLSENQQLQDTLFSNISNKLKILESNLSQEISTSISKGDSIQEKVYQIKEFLEHFNINLFNQLNIQKEKLENLLTEIHDLPFQEQKDLLNELNKSLNPVLLENISSLIENTQSTNESFQKESFANVVATIKNHVEQLKVLQQELYINLENQNNTLSTDFQNAFVDSKNTIENQFLSIERNQNNNTQLLQDNSITLNNEIISAFKAILQKQLITLEKEIKDNITIIDSLNNSIGNYKNKADEIIDLQQKQIKKNNLLNGDVSKQNSLNLEILKQSISKASSHLLEEISSSILEINSKVFENIKSLGENITHSSGKEEITQIKKALVSNEGLVKNITRFIDTELTQNLQDINKKLTAKENEKSHSLDDKSVHRIISSNKFDSNVLYDRINALVSIHSIIQPVAPLPIMHEWTVSSDYGLQLLTSALKIGKGTFVDVGSGISTLLLGYAAQINNRGKAIAIEHSEEYYLKTKELIKFHQLDQYCEVHLCPLKKYTLDNEEWLWYDVSKVTFPKDINLVSVDGPPGSTQKNARYPALPILHSKLNKQTMILLDDANRSDEIEIAKIWSEKFKLSSQLIKSHKNYYILNHL